MNDPAVVMVQGGRKPDQGFPPPPVSTIYTTAENLIKFRLTLTGSEI